MKLSSDEIRRRFQRCGPLSPSEKVAINDAIEYVLQLEGPEGSGVGSPDEILA